MGGEFVGQLDTPHKCVFPMAFQTSQGKVWKCDCGRLYVRNDRVAMNTPPEECFRPITRREKKKIGFLTRATPV